MWVYEEVLADGRRLSQVINERHENVRYLPGIPLPDNIIAVTDLVQTVEDASLLVFVMPHQFVKKTCETIKGRLAGGCRAISLIKGIEVSDSGIVRVSELISQMLDIRVSVLMGANIADEVAREQFCEATIGLADQRDCLLYQRLFNTDYFKIACTLDVAGVELCGALKM